MNSYAGVLSTLNGHHLRISGNYFPPYVYTTKDSNGLPKFAGTNYEIVLAAAAKSNFTFDLDAPRGKATGLKLPNGTWTGLFGDIYYNRSDVAIVLAHTLDRNGLIDFTSSFGSANLVFATALAKTEINPSAIAYAFDQQVWILFLTVMILCIPIVYFGNRLATARQSPHQKPISFINSALTVMKLCLEESTDIPLGANFPSGLLLVFGIVMGTGYKCNLLSLLSFPDKEQIPATFEQLGERSDYKVYFDMSGIVGYNFFMKGEAPLVVNLRTRFKDNLVRGNPARCAVSALVESKTACIAWHTVMGQVKGTNLTGAHGFQPVYQTRRSIFSIWVTLGLQKNSQFTKAFSFITSSYFETGHLTRWLDDIYAGFQAQGFRWMKTQKGTVLHGAVKKAIDDAGATGVTKPLALGNFKVVFAVLFVGWIVALVQFGAEKVIRMRKYRKRFHGESICRDKALHTCSIVSRRRKWVLFREKRLQLS